MARSTRASTTKQTTQEKPSGSTKRAATQATNLQTSAIKKQRLSSSDADPSKNYWLMKAEPESRIEKGRDVKFSIEDLAACTEPEPWDGVRNYAARNNMRMMKANDLAFFYHSNCKTPGIVGIMTIVEEASTDESAFDREHPYFDPSSSPEKPKWSKVKVSHVRTFSRIIPLPELKSYMDDALADMQILKTSRLSVSRVSPNEWEFVLNLEQNPVKN